MAQIDLSLTSAYQTGTSVPDTKPSMDPLRIDMVLELVLNHCTVPTLRSATLVNHHWYHAAAPVLSRKSKVEVSTPTSIARFFREIPPSTSSNPHSLRSKASSEPSTIQSLENMNLTPWDQNSSPLVVVYEQPVYNLSDSFDFNIKEYIFKCQNGLTISSKESMVNPFLNIKPFIPKNFKLGSFSENYHENKRFIHVYGKQIHELEFHHCNFYGISHYKDLMHSEEFVNMMPSLEKITVREYYNPFRRSMPFLQGRFLVFDDDDEDSKITPKISVKQIKFIGTSSRMGYLPTGWRDFHKAFPNLTNLSLKFIDLSVDPTQSSELPGIHAVLSCLTSLTLESPLSVYELGVLSEINFTSLKHFKLTFIGSHILEPETREECKENLNKLLIKISPTIEHLSLGCSNEFSRDLQPIRLHIPSCPKLISLANLNITIFSIQFRNLVENVPNLECLSFVDAYMEEREFGSNLWTADYRPIYDFDAGTHSLPKVKKFIFSSNYSPNTRNLYKLAELLGALPNLEVFDMKFNLCLSDGNLWAMMALWEMLGETNIMDFRIEFLKSCLLRFDEVGMVFKENLVYGPQHMRRLNKLSLKLDTSGTNYKFLLKAKDIGALVRVNRLKVVHLHGFKLEEVDEDTEESAKEILNKECVYWTIK